MSVSRRIGSRATRNTQSGVGLIEVLVALIVVGVGMLGVATLYVKALQAKSSALSRMHAVNLASDMADRIRSNREAIEAYELGKTATAAAPTKTCIQTATPAVECTSAEMAAADLNVWHSLVTGPTGLPGTVTRSITVDDKSPHTYVITLGWTEPRSGALNYALEVQL